MLNWGLCGWIVGQINLFNYLKFDESSDSEDSDKSFVERSFYILPSTGKVPSGTSEMSLYRTFSITLALVLSAMFSIASAQRGQQPATSYGNVQNAVAQNSYAGEVVAQQPAVRTAERPKPRTFVPRHLRTQQADYQAPLNGDRANVAGAQYVEGTVIGGESVVGGGCADGSCQTGYVGGGCADPGCTDCGGVQMGYGNNPCGYSAPPSIISFADMEYGVGVNAFKGPVNLGRDGSFGFNESINWGFPLPIFVGLQLNGQLGVRFVQANANGTSFSPDSRAQTFVTAGLSRRVDYGLQGGVAFDLLQEDWYLEGTFGQLRAEVSWKGMYQNEIGFRLTIDMEEETGLGPIINGFVPGLGNTFQTFVPLEQYRIFYRRDLMQSNGVLDVYAGFSGNSQGLVGTDLTMNLTETLAIESSFVLLIDDGGQANGAHIDESWNVGINLVYQPKGWTAWRNASHRPLFRVADNGSFMISR